MKSNFSILAVTAVLAILAIAPASAQVSDPTGDWVTGYLGPKNGDLDVVLSNVAYTPTGFIFTTTLNGAIGTTPNALYVWGLDRGKGTPRLASVASNVLFDSVVTVTPGGVGTARDLISGAAVTNGIVVTINGSSLEADVPLSALPSLGLLTQDQYTWNLWPRISGGAVTNISDFAPDNSNVRVTAITPEPGSVALLVGLTVTGAGLLRRRAKKRGA